MQTNIVGICRRACLHLSAMRSFSVASVVLILIQMPLFRPVDGYPRNEYDLKNETVMIAVLVRNKQHTLPYFLSYLERLDYPKDRISLWISSDNNVDNSTDILRVWLEKNGAEYHGYKAVLAEDSKGFPSEKCISDWNVERQKHVTGLREEALRAAKAQWADYLWALDADVFITEPGTLWELISHAYIISAPMLQSIGYLSNFWGGMDENHYYRRTDEYLEILNKKKKGCFPVPMVHSSVLIDLRAVVSDYLTYDSSRLPKYNGPVDDIISFAVSASSAGVPLMICNEKIYGYMMPTLEMGDDLSHDVENLQNIKMEALCEGEGLTTTEDLASWVQSPGSLVKQLQLHQVYVINLLRRPERKWRMTKALELLNISATFFQAVDLVKAEDKELEFIHMMPSYEDPYHKRPMKKGEVGCFLSHYKIWEEIMRDKPSKPVLVLEDDVRFEPFFRNKLDMVLKEAEKLFPIWDFIYLGRKRMHEDEEEVVGDSGILVRAGYSYWTIGYIINYQGASKLVNARPLENFLPVDEYIPILSDSHPRDDWKKYYKTRDLVVLSAEPLLLYPLAYVNSPGYVSDTEDSPIIPLDQVKDEL